MQLTTQQLSTLKALAQGDGTAAGYLANGQDIQLAEWFNGLTAEYMWRMTTNADDVADAVVWANLTPVDTPDDTATYTNRALMCQAKQINLQILLQGKTKVASSKPNVRAGFSDALLNVPSGVAGALQSAGWAGVKSAMSRLGTRAEMALASGAGTQAAPSTPAIDGNLTSNDASNIRNAA